MISRQSLKHDSDKCKCDICMLERFKRSPPPRTPSPCSENESRAPLPPPALKHKFKLASSYKF